MARDDEDDDDDEIDKVKLLVVIQSLGRPKPDDLRRLNREVQAAAKRGGVLVITPGMALYQSLGGAWEPIHHVEANTEETRATFGSKPTAWMVG